MSKRTTESNLIKKYTDIYKSMPQEQLQEEFDALTDQIMGFLFATDCSSIEVMYDRSQSLLIEHKELISKPKEQLN